MNEQQMRYIHAIAEEGSILKASLLLNKNPSTLTRVLKKCEEDLGISLFKRTRRGMVLTPEGESVERISAEILLQLSALGRQTEDRGKYGGKEQQPLHEWKEQEIRYLLAVREHGTISGAARELYLAQPSLSQSIKELEKELGSPVLGAI